MSKIEKARVKIKAVTPPKEDKKVLQKGRVRLKPKNK